MPAKIRRIKGFTQSSNTDGINRLIDFNKSINPSGGTVGKIIFKPGKRSTRIKLFQDKNDDGIFSKQDLIYKGKIIDTPYDEITNVAKVKLWKQMHQCDWSLMKMPKNNDKTIACTLDYVPTLYRLSLFTDSGQKITPEGVGEFGESGFLHTLDPAIT